MMGLQYGEHVNEEAILSERNHQLYGVIENCWQGRTALPDDDAEVVAEAYEAIRQNKERLKELRVEH